MLLVQFCRARYPCFFFLFLCWKSFLVTGPSSSVKSGVQPEHEAFISHGAEGGESRSVNGLYDILGSTIICSTVALAD